MRVNIVYLQCQYIVSNIIRIFKSCVRFMFLEHYSDNSCKDTYFVLIRQISDQTLTFISSKNI